MAHIPYESLNNMQQDAQMDVMSLPEHIAVISPGLKKRELYRSKLNGLGKAEIVIGVFSLVLGIVVLALVIQSHEILNYAILSPGIWCGIFLLVTGILGIKARGNPSVCMYNANMTLSILASIAMAVQTAFPIMDALALLFSFLEISTTPSIWARFSIEIALSILGLVGMIISIIHSAYCCKGVCCLHSDYSGMLISEQGDMQQPQQVVQLANGQFVLVPTRSCPVSTPGPYEKNHPAHNPESLVIQEQVSTMQGIQMPPTVDNPPGYSNAHASSSQDFIV